MKRIFLSISILLLAVTAVFGQASTEGKDFWVSSTIVCPPDKTPLNPQKEIPYIAISAEKACYVTIQYADGTYWVQNQPVGAGSWNAFKPASLTDLAKWYPSTMINADNVRNEAGQIHNYGLHITATQNVSVYVVLSSEYSMDASNILPLSAIQSEYYTQDFWANVKSGYSTPVAMTTILATENNTVVDITPSAATYDSHAAGQTYQVTLQQGQTYYLMTQEQQTLSGTHILAQGGKKIAVFNGTPLINIPSDAAARDCLFEQAMPVDYWGTQFVATRSLEKNGNVVGITAMEDGTSVKINGTNVTRLNAGESYYVLLQNQYDPYSKYPGAHPFSRTYMLDAIYIETSCPCCVYSYDTGNSFAGKDGSEIDDDKHGDPSSVWISPLQQKINKITFGACYTDATDKHFINVIAETAYCQQTKLLGFVSGRSADMSNLLTWTPISGTAYSYARAQISNKNSALAVFSLSNAHGLIAHVYGNGKNESYAYSVGSSAAKRGVNVDGLTFIDGGRYSETFCLNTEMLFDAQVGTDIVDKVDWDFGDGVTLTNSSVQMTHTYESPGWYDVYANIYAHKDCPETVYPAEQITFSFRVAEPDTFRRNFFICEGETFTYGGNNYTEATVDTAYFNCDSVVIFRLEVGQASSYEFDTIAQDQLVFGGQTYYKSGDYTMTLVNAVGCDSVVTCHARIVTCLEMSLGAVDLPICGDQDEFVIPYTVQRGDVGDATLVLGNTRIALDPNDDEWAVPMDKLRPGRYPSAYVEVEDTNCMRTVRLDLPLEILYPSSIFEMKWEDVLAVLNQRYNGGYDVVAYQWYRNGQPIQGATSSVYYVGPDAVLQPGDEYAVLLTTRDGVSLMSCPKVIPGVAPVSAEPTKTAILIAPGVLMLDLGNEQQYIVR